MPRNEPNWSAYVRENLPHLGLRPEREADVMAELAGEFEQAYRDALSSGMTDGEAEVSAKAHVKDWQALARELRQANAPDPTPPLPPPSSGNAWAGLWHDLRYAARTLRLNPMFASIAVLTLAFGIGANTAIFTVVDHLALRGLPYPDSSRLVNIEHTKVDQPEVDPWCAIDNLLDFRKRSQSFESISGVSPLWNVVMEENGDTERLESLFVSGDFFPMLGMKPALGRAFTAQEDDRVQPVPVAMLSHAFWTRRFSASPAVIGRTLRIDGTAVQVVGILPKDFEWLGDPLSGTSSSPEVWMPLAFNQLAKSPRTLRFLKVTGKLRPGVSIEQVRDEVRRIGADLTNEFPAANKNLSFAAVPLETRTTAKLRPAVFMLLATVGIVLLLASANVANLLIARATSRKREIAVRVALGASRMRLLRQLLTESFLLAACGGLLGLALAQGLLKLILVYGPASMLMRAHIGMDARAFLFTSGVVLATALLAGIIPAWRVILDHPGTVMREGRGLTRNNRFVRSVLAGAQVTIALVLLTGSGLLIRSFLRVLEIHPGFDSHNLLSITTQVPPQSNPQQRLAIYNAIREKLLATPGVAGVGAVSRLPMLGQNLTSVFTIEGQETTGRPPEVEFRAATPDYFSTMGIPLKAGRIFEDRNAADRLVLMIDELTAQRFFPNADPVGKRVRFLADNNAPWFTIIGVVGTIRHFGLEAEPRPTIYRPAIINPLSNPVLLIRTSGDPAPMAQNLARIVRTAHGNMPAYSIFVMDQLVDRSTAERKFLMWLITAFAAGALLLAGIGVYGAISQSVAQRTQEIGIRVALGASPGSVLRILFEEGGRIAGAGIACGLILGWIGANLGQKLLFRIQPHDALVFTIAASTLALFSLLACYIPARRALRVDPVVALRTE